jgi:sulfate transport system permease protein
VTRRLLIALSLVLVALFVLLPLGFVFFEALRAGGSAFFAAIRAPEARSALTLTLITAAIAVPLNLAFGLAAAWLIARFRFPGRRWLGPLIDLPLAISPVVGGLLFVLLFGRQGWLGAFLARHHFRILYATPGIILATLFVTLPYVAREVLPLMQSQGANEELASLSLGANGPQTFWHVTLPKVKWALLYGVVLCSARAMGEFGAVSVVSGHIRGVTDTVPLQIEVLYNQYDTVGAFAAASILALLGLATLGLKKYLEWKGRMAA